MNRTVWAWIVLGAVLAGCYEPVEPTAPIPPDTRTATAAGDDLIVTLGLPKTTFETGERFRVSILAANQTDQRLRIQADSGAPYFVSLWRYTGTGWDKIKRYPVTPQMVLSEWYLAPFGTRRFAPMVTVEPDWPTRELLRLQVELNGRPDVAPWVSIEVVNPEAPPRPEAPQPDEPLALDLISGSESDAVPTGSEDAPAENVSSGKPRLTGRARRLIDAIRDQYAGVPVAAEFVVPTTSVGVKSSS